MNLTLLYGLYPDYVGKRFIFVGSGNGPTAYTTGGVAVTVNQSQFYIDALFGGVLSVSGTYYVMPIASGVGTRQTWKLKWFVTATQAEVGNGVSLAAEQIQIGGFGGQF